MSQMANKPTSTTATVALISLGIKPAKLVAAARDATDGMKVKSWLSFDW
jgi:hypothetical protein